MTEGKKDIRNWTHKPHQPIYDPAMEEMKKADLSRQKDLVLAQIEYLEDTDPNYHRPEWISKDEVSTRRKDGLTILTEGESYLASNKKMLERDIERFFPRPHED